MKDYTVYIDSATKIKVHLKYVWEYLEDKIGYLKGDIQTYNTSPKKERTLLSAVLKSSSTIVMQKSLNTDESIYVDNCFADLLEGYLSLLIDLKEIEKSDDLDYNSIFEKGFTLIANIRNYIKKIDAFCDVVLNPIQLPSGERIKDDRVEITINSLKNLYGENSLRQTKNLRKFLFIRFFGFPLEILAIISLAVAILVGAIEFSVFFAKSREIIYLQQESMELYNEALEKITFDFINSLLSNPLVVIPLNLIWKCPIISLIYLIVGKILHAKLLSKSDLTVEEKYFLAFMYIDKGIFTFKYNLEKHKILIIECAEEGSIDANLRLGDLCAKGYFEKTKLKKVSKQSIELALRCYKRAFPDKTAVKKHNKLEKRLHSTNL